MKPKPRRAYRQGDVLVLCGADIPTDAALQPHAVLAEGEVTGHKHQVTEGRVRYLISPTMQRAFLAVDSPHALLTHEEHGSVRLPRGNYEVRIQREYTPDGWTNVVD